MELPRTLLPTRYHRRGRGVGADMLNVRGWRWYSKVALVLVVGAFAWFVWPTPWESHDRVRVNRFTGRTQVLTGGRGWTPSTRPRAVLTQVEVTTGVIQARGFELVDGNGTPRALLSVQADGQPGLSLLDRAGNTRATLFTSGDLDRPVLVFMDSAGNPRVGIGMRDDDTPEVMTMTPEGTPVWRAPF